MFSVFLCKIGGCVVNICHNVYLHTAPKYVCIVGLSSVANVGETLVFISFYTLPPYRAVPLKEVSKQ